MRHLPLLVLPALLGAAEPTYRPMDNERIDADAARQLTAHFADQTARPTGIASGSTVELRALDGSGAVVTIGGGSDWAPFLSCGPEDTTLILPLPQGTTLAPDISWTVHIDPAPLQDPNPVDAAYVTFDGGASYAGVVADFGWNFTIDSTLASGGVPPELVVAGFEDVDELGNMPLSGSGPQPVLVAIDRDLGDRPDLLTYTLAVPPPYGEVERELADGDRASLQAGDSWTQAELDAGRIHYRNRQVPGGITDPVDRIGFTISSPVDATSPTGTAQQTPVRWLCIGLNSVGAKDFSAAYEPAKSLVQFSEADDGLDADRDGVIAEAEVPADGEADRSRLIMPNLDDLVYTDTDKDGTPDVPAGAFGAGAWIRIAFADTGLDATVLADDRLFLIDKSRVQRDGAVISVDGFDVATVDGVEDGEGSDLLLQLDASPVGGELQRIDAVVAILNAVRYISWSLALPDATRNLLVTIDDGQGQQLVEAVGLTITAFDNPPRNPRLAVFGHDPLWVGGQARAEDRILVDDPDGSAHRYEVVGEPSQGSVTMADDGSFVYRPFLAGSIDDVFTVEVDPDSDYEQLRYSVQVRISDADGLQPRLISDPIMQLLPGEAALMVIDAASAPAGDGIELRLWGDVPDDVGLLPADTDAADEPLRTLLVDAESGLFRISLDATSTLDAESLLRTEGGLLMTALEGDERNVGYLPFSALIVQPETAGN